eukprot:scaffold100595_cov33-Tisochrysis_lutea.AAC.3
MKEYTFFRCEGGVKGLLVSARVRGAAPHAAARDALLGTRLALRRPAAGAAADLADRTGTCGPLDARPLFHQEALRGLLHCPARQDQLCLLPLQWKAQAATGAQAEAVRSSRAGALGLVEL